MQNESGVDIRVVLAPDSRGSTPEQFAVATMRELGIGRETGARGVLILYDTLARTMRVEVGPKLEGVLTDAFVGYLMREHLDVFFNAGRPEFGLRTTLLHDPLAHPHGEAGGGVQPSVRGVHAGRPAGRLGRGRVRAPEHGAGRRETHQPDRRHSGGGALPPPAERRGGVPPARGMARAGRGPDGRAAVHPASRAYLQRWLPLSPAFNAYLLASEYGRRYLVDERGDMAMLYYTDDPFVSPKFFRRTPDGWQMDIDAEVANSQEVAGMWYTWRLRVSGDDFSQVFADRYTPMLIPGMREDFYRVAGGDNRALWIRGGSKTVESELGSNRMGSAESMTDGVPGVEYLTVRTAAERIRAARGRPAVVLLYGIWNKQTMGQIPEIVQVARACQDEGVNFFAFQTDQWPQAVRALPDTLRKYGAPFPTVQLYNWRSGMLDATMGDLGISVGMSWRPPLVAVLDPEGNVVWQAKGVTDWARVEKTALAVARTVQP